MSMLLAALLLVGAEPPADTVVICPTGLRDALQPWVQHRETQGHRIALLPSHTTAAAIRDAIRRAADAGPLRAIVLVGDAQPEPGSVATSSAAKSRVRLG